MWAAPKDFKSVCGVTVSPFHRLNLKPIHRFHILTLNRIKIKAGDPGPGILLRVPFSSIQTQTTCNTVSVWCQTHKVLLWCLPCVICFYNTISIQQQVLRAHCSVNWPGYLSRKGNRIIPSFYIKPSSAGRKNTYISMWEARHFSLIVCLQFKFKVAFEKVHLYILTATYFNLNEKYVGKDV